MLYSHVLDSETKRLHSGLEVDILKFEAIKALTPLRDIRAFAYAAPSLEEHQFAHPTIAGLWKLYDSLAPDFKWAFREYEVAERRRFTQRPVYVATADTVVGGLWIDAVRQTKHGPHASIHLFVDPHHSKKGIASALLDAFEAGVARRYAGIFCSWGKRDDARTALFFSKQGYTVEPGQNNSGSAVKLLSRPVLQNIPDSFQKAYKECSPLSSRA